MKRRIDVIELHEQMDNWLTADSLSPARAHAIASHDRARIDVDWPTPGNLGRWRLRPRGWVGSIPIGEDLLVRIRPKLPVGKLFELLMWAEGLRALDVFEGVAPGGEIEDGLTLVVRLLVARASRRIARGLAKEYAVDIRKGPSPHGRVRFRESARLFLSGRPSMVWEERPLTIDNIDNRLIAWALRLAARSGVADVGLRAEVIRVERLFGAWTTPQRFGVAEYRHRIEETRHLDYAAIHALCALVVSASGPSTGPGDTPFVPFGIDVPSVFERSVFNILARSLPAGLLARRQRGVQLGAGLRFVPDIVIELADGRVAAVLDTKYKASVEQADVQQAVAYATALNCRNAFLVYPARSGRGAIRAGEVAVHPVVFDMECDPIEEGRKLSLAVQAIVRDPDVNAGVTGSRHVEGGGSDFSISSSAAP